MIIWRSLLLPSSVNTPSHVPSILGKLPDEEQLSNPENPYGKLGERQERLQLSRTHSNLENKISLDSLDLPGGRVSPR